jgi:hypothetical protein
MSYKMTSTYSDAKSFEFEKDLLRRFFARHQSSWRIKVFSGRHFTRDDSCQASGYLLTKTINNKLKDSFGATTPPYSTITY